MPKDAYYFSHDSNARNDEKILMLRAEHGWEAFKIVPCDYVVDANRPLDEVIKLVKEVIEGGN